MFRRATTIEGWLKFGSPTEREQLSPMKNEVKFENFYNEHSRSLWAYVRRVSNSAEIADDTMQESFMRFLGASHRSGENKKAYLYRIATNLACDYFRRDSREIKHHENDSQ